MWAIEESVRKLALQIASARQWGMWKRQNEGEYLKSTRIRLHFSRLCALVKRPSDHYRITELTIKALCEVHEWDRYSEFVVSIIIDRPEVEQFSSIY